MRRWVVLWIGVGLVAGCGGPGNTSALPPSPSATTSSVTPAPAAPLGTAAYQAELTRADRELTASAAALTRVRTAEALSAATDTLAESLNTISARFDEITVIRTLSAAHGLLRERLAVAAAALADPDRTEDDARCGGAAYTSQKVQRRLRADLQPALALLQQRSLRLGTTLPDPGPEPEVSRPSTGTTLVRRGPAGTGRLKLTNGTADDVSVSIVTVGQPPGSPHVMVYLHASSSTTINRIGGAYRIYFKSGGDWDPQGRRFRADCSFQKFDQTFGKNQGWQVNLEPSPAGNAKTTEVEAY